MHALSYQYFVDREKKKYIYKYCCAVLTFKILHLFYIIYTHFTAKKKTHTHSQNVMINDSSHKQ